MADADPTKIETGVSPDAQSPHNETKPQNHDETAFTTPEPTPLDQLNERKVRMQAEIGRYAELAKQFKKLQVELACAPDDNTLWATEQRYRGIAQRAVFFAETISRAREACNRLSAKITQDFACFEEDWNKNIVGEGYKEGDFVELDELRLALEEATVSTDIVNLFPSMA
ncbi:hypothetical protein BT63DRAFT_428794 [Microthyrium microscopicum]|uniref:Uncharacterized protein n=1 Tax=Microthyrium microscopicum TaxID=703497 RepID=A0A6A6U1K4_9PEZI|nr:hypothetical protein BT63DRAFT_428794 [Microthyrium microscopicum]